MIDTIYDSTKFGKNNYDITMEAMDTERGVVDNLSALSAQSLKFWSDHLNSSALQFSFVILHFYDDR